MDPQQKAVALEFDKYARTYDNEVNRAVAFSGLDVDFFTRVKQEHLVEMLQRELPSVATANVLDLGCGIGKYHKKLRPEVGTLCGVDVSTDCLATAASENADVQYSHYDGTVLPFGDGQFDAAFTICVMHHVPPSGWSRFVSEMKRVIRKGGIAVVYEHNPFNPLTRVVVNRCEFDRDAVLLSPKKVVELMTSAGFAACDTGSILTVPPRNTTLAKLDRWFGRLPFGAQYWVSGRRPND